MFRKISQSNLTQKQRIISQIQNDILSDFENSPSYQTVLINSIQRQVHIVDENNIIKNPNKKKLLCKPNETIKTGDLVEFNSSKWLCTEEDNNSPIYGIGLISKCNSVLNINKNNVITQVPCIVETNINLYKLGTEDTKFISEPLTSIVMRVQNNNITSLIKRDDIYKLKTQNYKVIDLNDDIQPGLLILKLEYSTEQQILPTYALTILNGDSIQIAQSQPLTINTQVTSNGEIIHSPSLTYSSSNVNIATIDENGVVTILSVGTVAFNVYLASDESVSDSIVVEVIADVEEQHNYTAEINGSNSIIKDKSANYTCIFKDNGVQMSGISSVFYLTSDDGVGSTNLASISSQDSVANSCVVLAGSNLGYVKLFVRNESGSIVSQPLRIQIKNIF